MKTILAFLTVLVATAGGASAQEFDPYKNTMNFTWASDKQPLFPIFYDAIYVGIVLVAVFLIYILYRSLKDRTYLDQPQD